MAQSTLQGHVLAGEERFTLEWHQNDDSVWCALLPVHILLPVSCLTAVFQVLLLLQV